MKLSAVVPCFNERATIREIIARLEKCTLPAGWEKEIVIVDDYSTDGTREILAEYETRHTILYRAQNGGKGSAVREGIAHATGDYLLIQDADLEYDPADIPIMLRAIEDEHTVVDGSRELGGTRHGGAIARIGVLGMTWLFNILHGTRLTDIWTCYRLFPRAAGVHFSGGRFESEILFIAAILRAGYTVKEVSISYNPRTFAEGKKIRYRDGVITTVLIIKDWALHLPRELFIPLGACALAFAIAFSISGIYNDRIDTAVYVAQIEAFQTLMTSGEHLPGLATFKPLPGIVGALLAFLVHPYTALLVMNATLFIGFVFAFYGFLRELSFNRVYAAIGASWVALAYPVLKYGLGLGTDAWGWLAATLVAMLVLNAVRTGRMHLVILASIIGFLGSIAKETAVLGLLFAGLYLIGMLQVWRMREVVRWLLALCVPFFVLQAAFLAIVISSGGSTFLDWYTANVAGYAENYRTLSYFMGVMLSTFNMLLVFAVMGFFALWKTRELYTATWQRTYAPLFLAVVPIFMWPIFISRIIFIQVLWIIPLALSGARSIAPNPAASPVRSLLMFALPPLVAITLYAISGNDSLFKVLSQLV